MNLIRQAWSGWKRVAHVIGEVQARVLLGAFYFVLLAPCALVVRWSGAETGRGWLATPAVPGSERDRAQRQY